MNQDMKEIRKRGLLAPVFFVLALCAALVGMPACATVPATSGSAAAEAGSSASASSEAKATLTANIYEGKKFNGVMIKTTEDELAAAGFALGDSVDVSFSNGFELKDVPYCNGYYAKAGDPVLAAIPGNSGVVMTRNIIGLWKESGLTEDDTVTFTLHKAKKYLKLQETLNLDRPTDRSEYPSDEAFTNFRALTGGNLKENFLYRGVSPLRTTDGRGPLADELIEAAGIQNVIDLADNSDEVTEYLNAEDFDSPYVKSLYDSGHFVALGMSADYTSDAYCKSVVEGMRFLLKQGGSAYIHCSMGRDRTGFVCMVVEALAGASYDEMCDDYMLTYTDFYKVTKDDAERYETIANLYFDDFLATICGTDDEDAIKSADYEKAAREYLVRGGMTEDEVDQLVALICK